MVDYFQRFFTGKIELREEVKFLGQVERYHLCFLQINLHLILLSESQEIRKLVLENRMLRWEV